MPLPTNLWSMRVIGQYLRPDGTPHRGSITLTPAPEIVQTIPGTGVTLVGQAARIEFDADGRIDATLLNPHDPTLRPGSGEEGPWPYRVQEVFQRGPILGWVLNVPADVGDGGTVSLSDVTRDHPQVIRPGDWFPAHYADTPVQASRISPRSGPMLRPAGERPGAAGV